MKVTIDFQDPEYRRTLRKVKDFAVLMAREVLSVCEPNVSESTESL